MKEPELEEEALTATAEGQTVTIVRRSLRDDIGSVTVTQPDGSTLDVPLEEVSPGRWEAVVEGPEIGLYRLSQADQDSVIALGPAAPREFINTIADASGLAPLMDRFRGGALPIEAGAADIRAVRAGRPAVGRGWIGITPREAYVTTDVRINPLVPAWAFLLLATVLIVGAWLREGRR